MRGNEKIWKNGSSWPFFIPVDSEYFAREMSGIFAERTVSKIERIKS